VFADWLSLLAHSGSVSSVLINYGVYLQVVSTFKLTQIYSDSTSLKVCNNTPNKVESNSFVTAPTKPNKRGI
jgi:hypothetical protein